MLNKTELHNKMLADLSCCSVLALISGYIHGGLDKCTVVWIALVLCSRRNCILVFIFQAHLEGILKSSCIHQNVSGCEIWINYSIVPY